MDFCGLTSVLLNNLYRYLYKWIKRELSRSVFKSEAVKLKRLERLSGGGQSWFRLKTGSGEVTASLGEIR